MRSVDQAQPWYGRWLVLACAFCNYVLIDGVRFSFGVLYVELLDAFGSGKSETAWIGSVQIGMFNLLGESSICCGWLDVCIVFAL